MWQGSSPKTQLETARLRLRPMWVVAKIKVPFLGSLISRCRIIVGTQKGTIISTTTHVCAIELATRGSRSFVPSAFSRTRTAVFPWRATGTAYMSAYKRFTQRKHMCHLCPNLEELDEVERGTIVGMAYISTSEKLKHYHERLGCGDGCSFKEAKFSGVPHHVRGCKLSPFAPGPYCNFMKHVIKFQKAIPPKGAGIRVVWPLRCIPWGVRFL